MDNLPKGLVSISEKVSAELGGIDAVDVGDIVQLWKAYNTSPSAHEGDQGYRLQNFFWRVWGSKSLSSSLTGSTLARLFLQISEPTTNSLRPATKESERPSSSLKHDEKHQHPPGNPSSSENTATTPTKPPLPPILKKSNSSSHGETQKTTRLLLTGLGGQSVTRKPSNSPTPIPPSRPVVVGDQQGSRPSQKKTFAVASKSKSSKRRPVLMRRKSSRQSSVSSTRAPSPQASFSPTDDTLGILAVQETEIDEEAVEDSPDNEQTTTVTATITNPPVPSNPPTVPNITTDTTANIPTYATADPDPDTEETPKLPTTFLTDLKTLMHKSTPLPPLRPRCSPPLVGFFSSTACRHFDVRHLSEENYEQPNSSTLVDRDFRTRFAEQKRQAEEYYQQHLSQYQGQEQMSSSLGDVPSGAGTRIAPELFVPNSTEAEAEAEARSATGTATEETVSPPKSRFGDSQSQSQGASTIATSILATSGSGSGNENGSIGFDPGPGPRDMFSSVVDVDAEQQPSPLPESGTTGATAVAVPVPGTGAGGNPLFLQSPALSVPRGPSGLSLLIEQSRSMTQGGMEKLNNEEEERSEE